MNIDLDKKVHHASGYQHNKKPRKSHERETHCDDHKIGGYNKNKKKENNSLNININTLRLYN
jgi:hypothetical protein